MDVAVLDQSGRYILTRALPEKPKGPMTALQVRQMNGAVVAEIDMDAGEDVQIADLERGRIYTLRHQQTLRPWQVLIDGIAVSEVGD